MNITSSLMTLLVSLFKHMLRVHHKLPTVFVISVPTSHGSLYTTITDGCGDLVSCRIAAGHMGRMESRLESLPALLRMLAVPTCTLGGEEVGDFSDAMVLCVVWHLTHEVLRDYADDNGRVVVAVGGDTVGNRKIEGGGNEERERCK